MKTSSRSLFCFLKIYVKKLEGGRELSCKIINQCKLFCKISWNYTSYSNNMNTLNVFAINIVFFFNILFVFIYIFSLNFSARVGILEPWCTDMHWMFWGPSEPWLALIKSAFCSTGWLVVRIIFFLLPCRLNF